KKIRSKALATCSDGRSLSTQRQQSRSCQNCNFRPDSNAAFADFTACFRDIKGADMTTVLTRRDFLRTGVAQAPLLTGGAPTEKSRSHNLSDAASPAASYAPNDQVQLALIGAGNQGQGDTHTALQIPGVRLVAAADCYDGRLTHCQEQ